MLIPHKGHTDTIQVYSVTVMTHVKALQAGHSSQGTSEPITPVYFIVKPSLSSISALPRPFFRFNGDTHIGQLMQAGRSKWCNLRLVARYGGRDKILEKVRRYHKLYGLCLVFIKCCFYKKSHFYCKCSLGGYMSDTRLVKILQDFISIPICSKTGIFYLGKNSGQEFQVIRRATVNGRKFRSN